MSAGVGPAGATGSSGRLLDVAGAAAYLGVGERFIRRLVEERRVRHRKVGRFLRFAPADLDAVVEVIEAVNTGPMRGPCRRPASTPSSATPAA